MAEITAYALTRQLGSQLTRLLADLVEQELITQFDVDLLRRQLADIRLDVRDYELAETRSDQAKHAKAACEHLERLRSRLGQQDHLAASEVASCSAQIEVILQLLV